MPRWEFVFLIHKVHWAPDYEQRVGQGYGYRAEGWEAWLVTPRVTELHPNLSDIDALNFLGTLGWDVINVEWITDLPPGSQDARTGIGVRQYLLHRRVKD